jgi:hypothetical protein
MITKDILKEKTGYDSFLKFKRHCQRSANSTQFAGLTKYFYDKNKTVELNMRPEELFMAADAELEKKKSWKKIPKKTSARK